MARQFFKWVGGPKQPVNSRINRDLHGVLFEGRLNHISFTEDEDLKKVFKDSPEFEASTKADFLLAGGTLDDTDEVEKNPEDPAPPLA